MIISKFSYLLFFSLGIGLYAISYNRQSWFGYRTKFSLSNDYNWKLSNRIASYFLILFSVVLFWIHQITVSLNVIIASVVCLALLTLILTELILYIIRRRSTIK